ncbi:hypothetical protein [Flavivirga eckloniae]|uniref:TonB C-terminal domain-containing protein n=1 Tax=Flavivirga eckloniae TaxID=1803846 RepID=A0A2K9PKN6_9FLAO|nr:hypothetical protein [Flavivirga eckloniae]AUP77586.1 hypothetical protein C1H87_02175 [Flavivirga eckloniae]
MKKTILILSLTFGVYITSYSQNFLGHNVIQLNEFSISKRYNISQKKSIKVGSIEKECHFLNELRGTNGEKLVNTENSSCCAFKLKPAVLNKGLLDIYNIRHEVRQPISYHFNKCDFEDINTKTGITSAAYKSESIKKIVDCDTENIFSVDDFLLKMAVGKLKNPDINPEYKGGIEELKKYFSVNALTDEIARNYIFRTSIGFKVNCKGEAGDFQIVTKGKGDLRELANQILEIVSNMPLGWIPAESDGQKVDCYQILSFTATYGSLENVSYRQSKKGEAVVQIKNLLKED